MPVSHLGLTVSHIPSATSFYLSALQPLGYRYVGQQRDSIGLGVESADFFLTQAPSNSRASPTHIAFSAASRLIVRECYTAALNAGGHPSGAPSYRNDDCTCFNAAVEDMDGNTVEFIYRQPHTPSAHDAAASSEDNHGRLREQGTRADSDGDDAHTINSRNSKVSKSTKKSETLSQESSLQKGAVPNTLIGAALGAAAGAAIVYAMCKEERKNAKDEAEYMALKQSPSPHRSIDEKRPPSPTAETLPPSRSEKPDRKSHRNFSTTESTYVSRRPSVYHGVRAIEPAPYDQDPILESISRYNAQQRPEPVRRQTYEPVEYISAPKASTESQFSMKRAVTLPLGVDVPNYYIEAPESTASSRHSASSRRSHRSHRSRRNSVGSASRLRRHDSGISVHSSRSHRERGSDTGQRSSTSTIKPSRQESRVRDHESTHPRDIPYDRASTRSQSVPRQPVVDDSRDFPYEQTSMYSRRDPYDQASTHSRSSLHERTSAHSRIIPHDRASTHSNSIPYDRVSAHSKSIPEDHVSTYSKHTKTVPEDYMSTHSKHSNHSKTIPEDHVSTHSTRSKGIPEDHISVLSKSVPSARRIDSYYESAAEVPLPLSVAAETLYPGSHPERRAPSRYEPAVEVPLPSSKASSYVSATQIPLPASNAGFAWEDIGEESDGLGDTRTVVPEDSISCVDFSKSTRPEKSSRSGRKARSSHHSSRRSDTSERTVRPAKKSGGSRHSAMTLPVRSKREDREDGKRSAVSYS